MKFAPYTRLNQPKLDVKQMGGYVSDGSAFNLGDPSSMRDQGMPRNCVYTATIKPEPGLNEVSVGAKAFRFGRIWI